MDKLSLAIQLSSRLNWGDMLAHIALPALDAICNEAFLLGLSDDDILSLKPNDIFGLLVGDINQEDYQAFIAARPRIEQEMLNGVPYLDAIHMWY